MRKCIGILLSFILLFVFGASCGSDEMPEETPDESAETEMTPEPTEAVPTEKPVYVLTMSTFSPQANVPSAQPIDGEEFDGVQLVETEDMGQEYIDNIIFLGDSTTYGLKAYGVLSGGKDTKQVWTPSSGTLTLSQQSFATIVYPETGNEITIQAAVEVKQPAMMVITLGVNGVSFMDEDYFKSEYTSLVEGIQSKSPNTKIILNSIYPVASNYEYLDSINNEKIAAANKWVKEVAESTGVRFLDTQSVLHNDEGFMKYEYSNGDGLHLSTDGFQVVLHYIRTHGYQ